MGTHTMSGTVLGAGDMKINRAYLCPQGTYSLMVETHM